MSFRAMVWALLFLFYWIASPRSAPTSAPTCALTSAPAIAQKYKCLLNRAPELRPLPPSLNIVASVATICIQRGWLGGWGKLE